MQSYEYKVFPAPIKGVKAKGVRGTSARFAHGLEILMNEAGAEGWEYLRADTLPCEERRGLRGRINVDQHVLVFRRRIQSQDGAVLMPEMATKSPLVLAQENAAPDTAQDNSAQTDPAPVVRLGPALRNPLDSAKVD